MTNSLVNMIQGNAKQRVPEVGMGCTFLHWTDRSAGTIVAVSASGKSIEVQADKATRTDSNGMSECQTYEYERQPDAPRVTYTQRKDGAWVRQGDPLKGGARLAIGYRDTYHDFSF